MNISENTFQLSLVTTLIICLFGSAGLGAADTSGYYDPSTAQSIGLVEAIKTGNLDRVRSLIESNTDLSGRDSSGDTPLILAIRNGHQDTARLLLKAGADPSIPAHPKRETLSGEPTLPLSIAASESHAGIAAHLVAAGADVNAKDVVGTRPLHWAALLGSARTLQVLLAAGADVDARTKYGATPLHYAAMGYSDNPRRGRSQAGIIGVLVAAGADVSARTAPVTPEIEKAIDDVDSVWTKPKWHEQLMIAHLKCTGKRTPLHLYTYNMPSWEREAFEEKAVGPARILVTAGAARLPDDQFNRAPHDYLGSARPADDLEYFLTGERDDDESSEAWAVAMTAMVGLAAHEAGIDDATATRIAGETYEATASSGIGGGLAAATRNLNQQLEARQREITRASAELQESRQNNNHNRTDAGAQVHSEAVARSRRFEQCLKSGTSPRQCYSTARTETGTSPGATEHPPTPVTTQRPSTGASGIGSQISSPEVMADSRDPQDGNPDIVVNEAIAICWSKTQSDWFCAGPTQTLWASEETREIALKRVGCPDFRTSVNNIAISRSDRGDRWKQGTTGSLFFCDRPRASYDENVRNEFEFSMPTNPSPRRYKCKKHGPDSEHWDTRDCKLQRP